jgi:hypothetical protein
MRLNYYKVATFFSRSRQESVLQEIEKSFYKALFPGEKKRFNPFLLQKISDQINFCVANYYFEKDLLECLLGFDAFISRHKATQESRILKMKGYTNRVPSSQSSCEPHPLNIQLGS